ncbi:TetR/AcrR family transcriptional regulator [Anaerosporobacter faecicola]|uniref:TetR/AcrR family transcriptional regulator n=1 Tax=Anaerosporobacter faecicola TaxID=2718714 RepID=UPI00143B3290|nr:TetR/AcrR family transcriptional regulator [Anaerosporobacter faecicola]
MNTTNGRIAEQSREKIICALLCVMERYSYKEITITQIAQEADLSRKTFYRLFQDKESVLQLLFDKLFAECMSQIRSQDIHHYWDVVQLYFDFWESQKDLLCLLKRHGLLSILFECSYVHAPEVFACVRSTEIVNAFSRQLPYLLAYAVGGMHSMLIKWIENDMDIPAAELIEKLKAGFMSPEI